MSSSIISIDQSTSILSRLSTAEIEKRQKLESLESLLREAIIARHVEVEKLTEENSPVSEINEARLKLELLKYRLMEAIVNHGVRIRRLEGRSEMEEAVKRLETLEADYKEVTRKEQEDVWGPEIQIKRELIRKMKEEKAPEDEIERETEELESMMGEMIIEQMALVRELRARWGRTEIAEAVDVLVRQKREFLGDFGREWSDVREEGPVLLTANTVRGSEVLPELREMTRQLRRENVLR